MTSDKNHKQVGKTDENEWYNEDFEEDWWKSNDTMKERTTKTHETSWWTQEIGGTNWWNPMITCHFF